MSADINSVTIVGRLTRDMELKYTNSDVAISNMGIAVNRSRKDGDQWVEEANFFDVTLFGRRGESLQQYLTKGTRIAVTGELRQERWEQDGQKRSRVVITANNIQLLGGNQNNTLVVNNGGRQDYNPGNDIRHNNRPQYQNTNNEDDIPF